MKIIGFHLLLTYQCTFACDHCFVWGSPFQSGVMTLENIRCILDQAQELGSVETIYFEGGEPFLYYPTLLEAVRESAGRGFQVGIVSNAYWATSEEDAYAALQPFAGLIQDLTVSSDLFHYGEETSSQVRHAQRAAERLGIPSGKISVAQPGDQGAGSDQAGVMYRGRAAVKLAGKASQHAWEGFNECPHENLADPGRVHIDPLGNIHLCQGILLGNLFQVPVKELVANYDPERHSVVGPLLRGGPAELVRCYGLAHAECYADACALCYAAREALRTQMPAYIGPDQVFGDTQAG